jgi:hypothetical protein
MKITDRHIALLEKVRLDLDQVVPLLMRFKQRQRAQRYFQHRREVQSLIEEMRRAIIAQNQPEPPETPKAPKEEPAPKRTAGSAKVTPGGFRDVSDQF